MRILDTVDEINQSCITPYVPYCHSLAFWYSRSCRVHILNSITVQSFILMVALMCAQMCMLLVCHFEIRSRFTSSPHGCHVPAAQVQPDRRCQNRSSEVGRWLLASQSTCCFAFVVQLDCMQVPDIRRLLQQCRTCMTRRPIVGPPIYTKNRAEAGVRSAHVFRFMAWTNPANAATSSSSEAKSSKQPVGGTKACFKKEAARRP